ncbi:STAS domain-containing protein [Actinomadura parmotrematis]|uniref:Anti-sigma factor antagonist n=1 Tax=Actinomadura parmotrematis TaxID=2864039 RepID=A0ABS7FN82_9ACTN|nr:STAS domain-containing protein [Actinomadura parmotrematis]MBW8481224.1 STAS domain-containing protein [Actinomadura parmotrematis]
MPSDNDSAAEAPDGLAARLEQRSVYAVATLAGSIDMGNHERLRELLVRALEGTRAALIVDMAGVDFCDSSGLGVFAHLARASRAGGTSLVVTGLRGRVARVFDATGMFLFLYAEPNVQAAVDWLDGGRRHPLSPSADPS